MTEPLSFTSSIDLPDGRHIYVSLDVPGDHPAGLPWNYVGENSEIVHMAAAQVLRLLIAGDKGRAKLAAEDIEDGVEVVF